MASTWVVRLGVLIAIAAGLLAVSVVVRAGTSAPGGRDSQVSSGPVGPLFDIGRLWLRAIVDQFERVFQKPDFTWPWTYVIGVASAAVIYFLYQLLFVPMNRVRPLGTVGYLAEGYSSLQEAMESVRRRRQAGDVPPVYPNGWFCVAESRELGIKEVKNVSCLGKQLAVFRAEDGRAHVIDAYCPHNGANMAAGGIVRGSCLECPFHGWQFRGDDGKCTHVPYADRKYIPDAAKVESYAVIERNGLIFFWYHAEGNDPTWEPPEIEQITKGEWTWRGRTEHIINAHIEEIPENGADVAHLAQVHGPIMTAGIDLRYTYNKWWSFARHDWAGQWSQDTDPDQKHVGILKLTHRIKMFGMFVPILDLEVKARQIGPGLVHLTFDSLFGSGAYLQVLTPIEPLTQRVVHHIYFNKYAPTFIAKFFMMAEALMVDRDLMIWNNKRYVSKPVLVKSMEDSLVQRHRRWYSQFYSEHSPRLKVTSDVEW